jgi:glyoxylase I family protein
LAVSSAIHCDQYYYTLRIVTTISVHHGAVNVDNLESALAFYVGELGSREDRPGLMNDGRWPDAGSGQIYLRVVPAAVGEGQHVALRVTDLGATVARTGIRGLEASTPEAIGCARQSFLHDPADNRVELQQALEDVPPPECTGAR